MRIWHQQLIPKLCRQHLLACWREALGAYKVITENKKGYRNHPATKEFEDAPEALYLRLQTIRQEMLSRGWNPKELPKKIKYGGQIKQWQTLTEQTKHLKTKGCECKIM